MANQGTTFTTFNNEFQYQETAFGITKFGYGPQLTTDGITSASLSIVLPKNAVVRKYDVVVTARRADATVVGNVAQVRAKPSILGTSIVVDFGTPRTVSAIQVPDPLQIVTVQTWIGTAFADKAVYAATVLGIASGPNKGQTEVMAQSPSTPQTAVLDSEVRTERLLVNTAGTANAGDISSGMAVVLPDTPSGLELRIDGANPVFTNPGPVDPGTGALSDSGWDQNSERIVHLGEALAKLTGDPTSTDPVTFQAVLTSQVPGVLNIGAPDASGQEVHFVRRVRFGTESSKDFSFASEGVTDLALSSLPANLTIEDVRFTASGVYPAERVLPPVGPDPGGLAQLVADANRAVLVRLRAQTGLLELTGVRLPLTAGPDGAEAAVALWSNNSAATAEPIAVISQAVTTPVTLNADASAGEQWTTFAFKQPVKIDGANPPWAALLVKRGQVSWELGASNGPHDPLDQNVVKRGPPAGPWRPLPSPFVSGTEELSRARGRIRMVGHAAHDVPLAPVRVELPGGAATADVTPTAKGVLAEFQPPSAVTQALPVLRITNFVAGTLTLRDLDVVSTT